jgi:hypothetical protein
MSEISKKNWRNLAAPRYGAMDEQRAGETNELLELREEEAMAFLWLTVFSTSWYFQPVLNDAI